MAMFQDGDFGHRILKSLNFNRRRDMSDNESAGGFGWFLAGLGVGALVGVLYAPKAGKDTRDDLVAGALDAKDKAGVLAQQAQEKANDLAQQGKQQVGEYVDRGKEYYDRGRTQWSQYVDKGKDLVQEQQDKVSAAVEAGKDAYASKTSEPA
jgi:gas vesicle protein